MPCAQKSNHHRLIQTNAFGRCIQVSAALALGFLGLWPAASAQPASSSDITENIASWNASRIRPTTTTRLVITWKDTLARQNAWHGMNQGQRLVLAGGNIYRTQWKKPLGMRSAILELEGATTRLQAQTLIAAWEQEPDVSRVEFDAPAGMHQFILPTYDAQTKPSDPFFIKQWNLQNQSASIPGAGQFFDAWKRQTQSSSIPIAVIDTGNTDNTDLIGQDTLGYDFISDLDLSGDGDGRDPDPHSPGNYCDNTNGVEHGLQTAQQIAAKANDGYGIVGAAYRNAKVQHIRGIGACGGSLADVAEAIRWAAGLSVPGIPINMTPAKIINLSLGGSEDTNCPLYMQEAVNAALAKNVTIVASSGNEGGNRIATPANCDGVISVGAHTHSGDLAIYSNYSKQLSLTAPAGGNCKSQTSCRNQGLPAFSPSNNIFVSMAGTSMAAPQVTAAVALMLAEEPNLKPNEIASLLKASATPHPSNSFCASHSGECGAGMLNASAALASIARPTISISGETDTGAASLTQPLIANNRIRLKANVQAALPSQQDISQYTFAWKQTSGTPISWQLQAPNQIEWTTPPLKNAGPIDIEVTATSAQQNTLSFQTKVSLQIDAPPSISLVEDPKTWNCQVGLPCKNKLLMSDPDGDALLALAITAPNGAVNPNGTLEWTPASDGWVDFEVAALTPQSNNARSPVLRFSVPIKTAQGATPSGSGQTTTLLDPRAPVAGPTPPARSGGGAASLIAVILGLIACWLAAQIHTRPTRHH